MRSDNTAGGSVPTRDEWIVRIEAVPTLRPAADGGSGFQVLQALVGLQPSFVVEGGSLQISARVRADDEVVATNLVRQFLASVPTDDARIAGVWRATQP